ncbi:MAG: hypothetical protein ACI4AO_05310 [Anaerotignum sp.]
MRGFVSYIIPPEKYDLFQSMKSDEKVVWRFQWKWEKEGGGREKRPVGSLASPWGRGRYPEVLLDYFGWLGYNGKELMIQ